MKVSAFLRLLVFATALSSAWTSLSASRCEAQELSSSLRLALKTPHFAYLDAQAAALADERAYYVKNRRVSLGFGSLSLGLGAAVTGLGISFLANQGKCTSSSNGVCTSRGSEDGATKGLAGMAVGLGLGVIAIGVWAFVDAFVKQTPEIERIDRLMASLDKRRRSRFTLDVQARKNGAYATAQLSF